MKRVGVKMIQDTRKGLNKEEIEVLILAVVILASGFFYLVLNFGLFGF
jgi:hypothetical protein